MILVDKEIEALANSGELIIHGYDRTKVNPVSYDITVDAKDYTDHYIYIAPGAYRIVKSKELIRLPSNIIARVVEKNSMIRTGLMVSGPVYQPGHETCCWLRVQNISCQHLRIWSGLAFAQLMFETIDNDSPERAYNNMPNASFNNETSEYKGFSRYQKTYEKMSGFSKRQYMLWYIRNSQRCK